MVWFVLAGMAACVVLAALWPLLRPTPGAKADSAANEAAFYKAQLEEIRRDVERGLLPQGEAESARAAPAPPPRGGYTHRRRTAGGLLCALCAPRPTHAAGRTFGEPQSRAPVERRDRGGGGGGRGAAHRQAGRRQRLGGDRASLYAP